MISRELFKQYMQQIKETEDRDGQIYEMGKKVFEDFQGFFLTKEIEIMVNMLSHMVYSEAYCEELERLNYCDNTIEYYIYELNWGTNPMAKDCIEDENSGETISLTNLDELYDYIVKENKEHV